jgi:predicted Zn-dependent protease
MFSRTLAATVLTYILLLTPAVGDNRDFQFRKIDVNLLECSNELDRHFSESGFILPEPGLNDYVQSIYSRLLAGRPAPENVHFAVRVLRDSTVQAFGLPNGTIYLTTGMLAALGNEGQLAGIVAREIAHVSLRHQYLQNREARTKKIAAKIALVTSSETAGSVVFAILDHEGAFEWVYGNGYGEGKETEADRDSVALMSAAGYDPRSTLRALERLDENLEIEPQFMPYRSEGKLKKRILDIRRIIDTSKPASLPDLSENDYLSHVSGAVLYNIGVDLESRRVRTSLARAKRLVNWKPDDGELLLLLADAYRDLGARTPEPAQEELASRANHRWKLLRLTQEEEEKSLLDRPGGAELAKANETMAAALYLKAIALAPSLPGTHRGLGMLYQKQARNDDAAREYRRFLELAPAADLDRLRIQRRLDVLDKH